MTSVITETNYLDKNIFELNKKIEQKFIINYEDLIKDFLSNIKGDNRYDFCVKLRNKFTPDEIYNIEKDGTTKKNISLGRYSKYKSNGIAVDNDFIWVLCYSEFLLKMDREGNIIKKIKFNYQTGEIISLSEVNSEKTGVFDYLKEKIAYMFIR